MSVVIDTSILIDHLRGDDRAHRLLERLRAKHVLVGSVLTRVEVIGGMRHLEQRQTFQLLSTIEWIVVDQAIADRAGELARRYIRSHPGIDPVDYVIAATSESLTADLFTRNLKHFPMFPGLLYPYE
ncbi:MAG: type II toxin-antitoxin system VapC family toxin [Candidatus Dormibacteraceae bacterium]